MIYPQDSKVYDKEFRAKLRKDPAKYFLEIASPDSQLSRSNDELKELLDQFTLVVRTNTKDTIYITMSEPSAMNNISLDQISAGKVEASSISSVGSAGSASTMSTSGSLGSTVSSISTLSSAGTAGTIGCVGV